ncbi:hypothetical protein SDRG_15798, partial [Saprolegnia diclina VS20]
MHTVVPLPPWYRDLMDTYSGAPASSPTSAHSERDNDDDDDPFRAPSDDEAIEMDTTVLVATDVGRLASAWIPRILRVQYHDEIAQWALPLPRLPPIPTDDDNVYVNTTGTVSTTVAGRSRDADATATTTDEVVVVEILATGNHTSLVDTIDGYHGRTCTCRIPVYAFAPQLRLRAALFSWMEHWRRG